MRYIVGVLITVGLLVFVIILLIRGFSSPASPNITINNYASNSNAFAKLVINGPIVAEQNHNEVDIVVNNSKTNFIAYQGYQQTNVVNNLSFNNNQSAFAVFLHALTDNGFNKGDTNPALSDERGHCAQGRRYIFSFNVNGKDIERYWYTSCGTGTSQGQTDIIVSLFQAQIPSYDQLTNNLNL